MKYFTVVAFVEACLAQFVDIDSQFGFQVRSFVLVDHMDFSQLVQHLLHAGKHGFSFALVGHGTKFTHSVTHGLRVISVVEASFLRLSDSF